MHIRPLYLGCFSYRRDVLNGSKPREVWGFANSESTSAQLQPQPERHTADSSTGRDVSSFRNGSKCAYRAAWLVSANTVR